MDVKYRYEAVGKKEKKNHYYEKLNINFPHSVLKGKSIWQDKKDFGKISGLQSSI